MKRETFNFAFAALVNAFVSTTRLGLESQDIYWEMLKDIPDDIFNVGVRKCLARCKYFPTIAELGEASLPSIIESAPYNPYIYVEPRRIDWQEQLSRRKQALLNKEDNKRLM